MSIQWCIRTTRAFGSARASSARLSSDTTITRATSGWSAAEATTRPLRRVALRNVRYAFWLKITFGTPGARRAMSSGPYASGTTSTSCPLTPIGGYTTRVVFSNHVQRNPARVWSTAAPTPASLSRSTAR